MSQHCPTCPKQPVTVEVKQFAHGQSNPTFLVLLDGIPFVIRKKPAGKLLPGAHQIEREYTVLQALRSSGVPVPLVYALCTDAAVLGTPFYVMQYVVGRCFKNPLLPGMSHADRFAIYHKVDRAAQNVQNK